MTCVDEHEAYQDDPYLGCHSNREYFKLPSEYRVYCPATSTSTGCRHNNDDDGNSSDEEYFECNDNRRRVDKNNHNGDSSDDEYSVDEDDGENESVDSDKSLLETFETCNSSDNIREFHAAGDDGRRLRNGRESSGRGNGVSQGRMTRSSNVVQRRTTRSATAAATVTSAKQSQRKSG